MMESMTPPQVGMRLRTKKKEAIKKEKRPKKGEKEKNERKREKGQCYYPLPHLCFKVAP